MKHHNRRRCYNGEKKRNMRACGSYRLKAVCFTRTKALQQQRTAIRDNTKESYGNRIYDHIIPDIGKILLNKLTQNDL